MDIKRVVRDGNKAQFLYLRKGFMYYGVEVDGVKYKFPIDITDQEELGDATFESEEKAITLMRYIRKAMAAELFGPA